MMSVDDLNAAAMKLILHAGNCRENIQLAMQNLDDIDVCENYLEIANQEILLAHRSQTQVIQDTIEENFSPNLLFIHAQDTVMTVNSELITARYIINAYKKLIDKMKG